MMINKPTRVSPLFFGALITLGLLSPPSLCQTKGWRGIVPMLSTRADVEALLGEGTNRGRDSYYRDDMNIFFVYSSGSCGSGTGIWNVAPETVISITIYPKTKPRLSEVEIGYGNYETKEAVGDMCLYINHDDGSSMEVWQDTVMSFHYGPSTADERLHCPDYDPVFHASGVPKNLRRRLLDRLNEFVAYSVAGQYERQYELYLPEFALKMFPAKNKREFASWVQSSGGFNETLIEFKPRGVSERDDRTFGKVYEVFGLLKTANDGQVIESYRTTRLILRNNEWYFVDLFRLIPA